MRRRQPVVKRLAHLAALVAACVALAGCSTSSDPDTAPDPAASATHEATTSATTTPSPEPTALTFEQVEAAYGDCLRANGSEQGLLPDGMDLSEVAEMTDLPDEVLQELGTTREAIVAHAACWPAFLEGVEAGATPPPSNVREEDAGGDEPADPELAAKMQDAVACLNERGWDFFEPGVETGPLTMEPRASDFDWADEAFLADQLECQQLAGMMG